VADDQSDADEDARQVGVDAAGFDFEVKYQKGLVNMNADGLSRNPQPETEDLTGAREHDDLPGELVVRDPKPVASVMLAWQAWAAADLPEGVEPLSVEEARGELWEPGEPAELENLAFPGNIDYGPPNIELPVPTEQGLEGKRARALTDTGRTSILSDFCVATARLGLRRSRSGCDGGAGLIAPATGC
jgi:hypothetical protein